MAPSLSLARTIDQLSFKANEGSELTPIDLKTLINNPSNEPLTFALELSTGGELPAGLTCTAEGIIQGTPAIGTHQDVPYDIVVVAQAATTEPLVFAIQLLILASESNQNNAEYTITEAVDIVDELAFKNYWQSVMENLDLPDLETLLTRKITKSELYYLLERFATFTVWNADDLRLAVDGKAIEINGASSLFQVYDFEVALVASPKDLYATNRTLADCVQTARAMIQEAHHRKWNVELTGYDKMIRAAGIEAARLNKIMADYTMEIENYELTDADFEILNYTLKSK
ncbi:MAG: hypothetical protein A2X77_06130 [Gammaproteobacteria bacterium GWE2_42_36]|nr:MAG: hypothetical protein A2X77_06130 [Gammaproteobacteria bacterium GWE2_42_36]HCU05027.1 hypothetical protein [Coxiellaceae bacterium]